MSSPSDIDALVALQTLLAAGWTEDAKRLAGRFDAASPQLRACAALCLGAGWPTPDGSFLARLGHLTRLTLDGAAGGAVAINILERDLAAAFPRHPLLPSVRQALAARQAPDAPLRSVAADNSHADDHHADAALRIDGETVETALAWRLCARLWPDTPDGRTAAAGCLQQALGLLPWRLDWQFALAQLWIQNGDLKRLAPFWRNPPVCFPAAPRWRLLRCLARWWGGGDVAGALADCRAAQALAPDWAPACQAELSILGEWSGLEAASAIFAQFRRDGRRRNGIARPPVNGTLTMLGRRLVRLNPQSAAFNDFGAALFSAMAPAAALEMFRRSLALDPTQRHAAINYAVALLYLDRTETLRRYLKRGCFLAALPPALCLELRPATAGGAGETAADAWRAPVDADEWRRRTVFSQDWWRALGREDATGGGLPS